MDAIPRIYKYLKIKTVKKRILKYGPYIFILLWGYAATVKLWNWENSRREMYLQPFPDWIGDILFWLIPLIELAIVGLLLYQATILRGIQATIVLLSIFTIYFIFGIGRVFGKIPCACGGILIGMGHKEHIFFNLLFITLGIYTWVLARKSLPHSDVSVDGARGEGSKKQ